MCYKYFQISNFIRLKKQEVCDVVTFAEVGGQVIVGVNHVNGAVSVEANEGVDDVSAQVGVDVRHIELAETWTVRGPAAEITHQLPCAR